MAIEVGKSTLRGGGGSVVVGHAVYKFPRLARLSWYTDPATGEVLALVFADDQLHVLSASGEVFGVPASVLERTERENFVT